jgi:hypothetical protein
VLTTGTGPPDTSRDFEYGATLQGGPFSYSNHDLSLAVRATKLESSPAVAFFATFPGDVSRELITPPTEMCRLRLEGLILSQLGDR